MPAAQPTALLLLSIALQQVVKPTASAAGLVPIGITLAFSLAADRAGSMCRLHPFGAKTVAKLYYTCGPVPFVGAPREVPSLGFAHRRRHRLAGSLDRLQVMRRVCRQ